MSIDIAASAVSVAIKATNSGRLVVRWLTVCGEPTGFTRSNEATKTNYSLRSSVPPCYALSPQSPLPPDQKSNCALILKNRADMICNGSRYVDRGVPVVGGE